MTFTSDLTEEAAEAGIVFQLAIAKIGAETLAEALLIWRRMSERRMRETADAWLAEAIQLILTRRAQSREIAVAYYRLVRALRTGTTVPRPNEPAPQYITLDTLREEFAELTAELVTPEEVADAKPDGDWDIDLGDDDINIDPERIEVEPLDDLDLLEDALDADAVEEAEVILEALGPTRHEKQVERARRLAKEREERLARAREKAEIAAAEYHRRMAAIRDRERQEQNDAYEMRGRRTAAAAERIAMNGARSQVWEMASRDRRVLGWIRVSTTGHPCAFCAMLLTRGFLGRRGANLYRSGASAGKSDGDKYHINCKCTAIPIYRTSDLDTPQFALNRELAEAWPRVTRGSDDPINAWRRWIRARNGTNQ